MFKLSLLICILFLLSCQSIPGGKTSEKFFQVEQSGIATITQLKSIRGKDFIEIDWHADNTMGKSELISNLGLEHIQGMEYQAKPNPGQKLNLKVIHFFKQTGSSTPTKMKSSWQLNGIIHLDKKPIPLKLLNMKRPPRCPNQ